MQKSRIGVAIAERELVCQADVRRKVVVKLGKPRRRPGVREFECPYQIGGPGVDVARCTVGMDVFQAIQLAYIAIGAHLSVIEEEWRAPLTWLGEDAGFPRS